LRSAVVAAKAKPAARTKRERNRKPGRRRERKFIKVY